MVDRKERIKLINSILIGFLTFEVMSLRKKVDKNEKIVGNLKISDLDEEFWDD